MITKNRNFENKKTEAKVEALKLWREGKKISVIARELKKSRETIYRWISAADLLSKGRSRERNGIDPISKNKIIEAYILLKAPSMERLNSALKNIYMIHLSTSQLRRALKKWGLSSYEPSNLFDSMIKYQASSKDRVKASVDGGRAVEISPKSAEHSSPLTV
ncbi:MAG: hypothetical protein JWQ35_798 [Bacteriovoracaceae bacterium]|nr:hypothetical protein [Bacteriovoracaceae bacterium]